TGLPFRVLQIGADLCPAVAAHPFRGVVSGGFSGRLGGVARWFFGEGTGTGWIIFVIMRKDAAVRSRIREWDGRRMSECLGWGGWLVSSLGGLLCRQGQHESP